MKAYIEEQTNELLGSIPALTELDYERRYPPVSLTLLFFLCSFTGWTWEVLLHLIADGTLVNRGMLLGPWLPIYGVCSVLVLILLEQWRDRPLHRFGLTMLLSGLVQYITSLIMENLFHARWWSCDEMLFNLNGRICLETLLIFGLCGLIFVYVLAPKLDNLFQTVSRRTQLILCAALSTLFLADFIYSFIFPNMGPGITL